MDSKLKPLPGFTPVAFNRYGSFGKETIVVAEKVTHWDRITLNGETCTELHFDNGTRVTVEGDAFAVADRLLKARAAAMGGTVPAPGGSA